VLIRGSIFKFCFPFADIITQISDLKFEIIPSFASFAPLRELFPRANSSFALITARVAK
jgi:hypothetical protein